MKKPKRKKKQSKQQKVKKERAKKEKQKRKKAGPSKKKTKIRLDLQFKSRKDPNPPIFDTFVDYNGVALELTQRTWDIKLAEPGRFIFEFNQEKLKETIASPDEVRGSESPHETENDRSYRNLYYKSFPEWTISKEGGILESKTNICCMVADMRYKRIVSIYRTNRLKPGKQLWPNKTP